MICHLLLAVGETTLQVANDVPRLEPYRWEASFHDRWFHHAVIPNAPRHSQPFCQCRLSCYLLFAQESETLRAVQLPGFWLSQKEKDGKVETGSVRVPNLPAMCGEGGSGSTQSPTMPTKSANILLHGEVAKKARR